MIKVGITGNIGSGKTTVCQIFERVGVDIYYADQRAKELMVSSEQLKRDIQQEFGNEVFQKTGKLDSAQLAKRVFNDEKALRKLNQLVHPIVFDDIKKWVAQKEKDGAEVVIEEAALTFEAGHTDYFDLMITVTAPERILIERVTERDNIGVEDVKMRLNRQIPQLVKALQSDIIILNDGQHSLIFQVQNIINRWQLPISKNVYN